jgi:hypothetical protein
MRQKRVPPDGKEIENLRHYRNGEGPVAALPAQSFGAREKLPRSALEK